MTTKAGPPQSRLDPEPVPRRDLLGLSALFGEAGPPQSRLDPEPVPRRDLLGLSALWPAAAAMLPERVTFQTSWRCA